MPDPPHFQQTLGLNPRVSENIRRGDGADDDEKSSNSPFQDGAGVEFDINDNVFPFPSSVEYKLPLTDQGGVTMPQLGGGIFHMAQLLSQAQMIDAEARSFKEGMKTTWFKGIVVVKFVQSLMDLESKMCSLLSGLESNSSCADLLRGHSQMRIKDTYEKMCSAINTMFLTLANIAIDHKDKARVQALRNQMVSSLANIEDYAVVSI
jgi:hypothetical protein